MRGKLFLTSNNNYIYIYRSVGVQRCQFWKSCKTNRGFMVFKMDIFWKFFFLAVINLKNVVNWRKNDPGKKYGHYLYSIWNHAKPLGARGFACVKGILIIKLYVVANLDDKNDKSSGNGF